MKNKKIQRSKLELYFICFSIGVFWGSFFGWIHNIHSAVKTVSSSIVLDPSDFCNIDYMNREPKSKCGFLIKKENDYVNLINEKGKKIGCTSDSMGVSSVDNGINIAPYYCVSNFKKYNWNDSVKDWVETDESKHCSKYADFKTSDVPITCVSYFK